jgi:hypothetical protein
MLAVVGGKLCCIVALVPCTSGTTLYTTTIYATIGSVVLYSGNCYTVTDTTSCGTITTGPFTTVSGCGDSRCSTACPLCSALASSYTVSGWAGTLPDCCWTGADCTTATDCTSCDGYSTWDGGMDGSLVGSACYFTANSTFDYGTTSVSGFSLCMDIAPTIQCTGSAGGGNYVWRLGITYNGSPAGHLYGWIGYYTGPTPAGTYAVNATESTAPCGTAALPATMTVS